MENKIKISCKICTKRFTVWPYKIKNGGDLYCSNICRAKGVGEKLRGKNNYAWTGNYPKYRTLHNWLRKKLGSAKKCKHCGKIKGTFHWANISGKYKRDIKDFISLCVPCHQKYDRKLPTKCSKCDSPYWGAGLCNKHYHHQYYLNNKNK